MRNLSTLLMGAPLRRRQGWAHYAMPCARGIEVLLNGKRIEGECLVADEKHGFCVCLRPFSFETYIVHGHVQIIDSAATRKPKVAAVRNFFRRPGA